MKMIRYTVVGALGLMILGIALNGLRAEDAADKALSRQLVGTWRCVSYKNGDMPEPVVLPKEAMRFKHVTPTHFLWIEYDPRTKLIVQAGGGSYTLKGAAYTEKMEYGLGTNFDVVRDREHTFTAAIEGDRWHHVGKLANGLKIDEVWERVKRDEKPL